MASWFGTGAFGCEWLRHATPCYAMLRTLASNQGTVKPPVSMSLQHLTRYDACGMASPTALVCLCHLCPRAEMCWVTVICNALQFLWVEQRALSLTIRDDSSDGTSFHLPAILILAKFSLDIWALKPMEPRTSVGKFRKGKGVGSSADGRAFNCQATRRHAPRAHRRACRAQCLTRHRSVFHKSRLESGHV